MLEGEDWSAPFVGAWPSKSLTVAVLVEASPSFAASTRLEKRRVLARY